MNYHPFCGFLSKQLFEQLYGASAIGRQILSKCLYLCLLCFIITCRSFFQLTDKQTNEII